MARRIVDLPDHGRLLVCTDLQGNRRDLERMVEVFRDVLDEEPDSHLVFAGDMIHGPSMPRADWRDWLGVYYEDDSEGVWRRIAELQRELPGRIHPLLGNHEHAHVGGVRTAKFYNDEAAVLEARMSPDAVEAMREWIRSLPLVVASMAGIVVTHAAPAAVVRERTDLDIPDYDLGRGSFATVAGLLDERPVLGRLLWSRMADDTHARSLLHTLTGRADGLCVFGHDVAPTGWQADGHHQLCVSTSFGVPDERKVYLDLSLDRTWFDVNDLTVGRELRALWPA
jgi:hypothetical protein